MRGIKRSKLFVEAPVDKISDDRLVDDSSEATLFIRTSTRGMTHVVVISPENMKQAAWYTTMCNKTVIANRTEKNFEYVEDVSCATCSKRIHEAMEKLK